MTEVANRNHSTRNGHLEPRKFQAGKIDARAGIMIKGFHFPGILEKTRERSSFFKKKQRKKKRGLTFFKSINNISTDKNHCMVP